MGGPALLHPESLRLLSAWSSWESVLEFPSQKQLGGTQGHLGNNQSCPLKQSLEEPAELFPQLSSIP